MTYGLLRQTGSNDIRDFWPNKPKNHFIGTDTDKKTKKTCKNRRYEAIAVWVRWMDFHPKNVEHQPVAVDYFNGGVEQLKKVPELKYRCEKRNSKK